MSETRFDAVDYPGAGHDVDWRRLVAPADYRNPAPQARYHMVVIGAGPAGLVASISAAGLGARVALIEKNAMGGDCLNVGCVPSKALLEYTAEHRDADFDAAFESLRRVRAGIAQHDSVERYRAAGVDVFLGPARFVDERTVEVGGAAISARRVVIATGSRAMLPPIPGLADSRPLTNETIFALTRPPARLAVIGAGPIGCELAQAFARLGVDVDLLEAADRVLARDHPEASAAVAAALVRAGVTLHTGADIRSVARRGSTVAIETARGEIHADELLVAAGRRPNTDELNLAAAGIETDTDGLVTVDRKLRTTNPRVYAAGDVCTRLQFTHHADAQARIVVQNALFAPTASTRRLHVPRCTYTAPEVAQIGPLAAELDERGIGYDVYRQAFGELDRGRTQDDRDGFAEILTGRGTARILGASIVGRDAGEQIAAVSIAMANGLGVNALGKALYAYPTRAEYLRRIADAYNRQRLTPRVQRLFRLWLKWRR